MLSTTNGHRKSSGKVSPTDAETFQQLSKQKINGTHADFAEIPVEQIESTTEKSVFNRLFKKVRKGNEAKRKEKPEGPKLKTFEIVYFFFAQSTRVMTNFL